MAGEDGINAGTVHVDVVPDVSRFGQRARQRLDPEATALGRRIGERLADSIVAKASPALARAIRDGGKLAVVEAAKVGREAGARFGQAFRIEVERRKATPRIDVDTTSANRKLDTVLGKVERLDGQRPTITVDADTGAATAKLTQLSTQVRRLGRQRTNIGGGGLGTGGASALSGFPLPDPSRFLALAGAIAAVTPPLVAVASSAGLASTSIVALGAAVIGTATAVAAVKFAFGGVAEALKASEAAEKSAASTGASAAAQRIAQARAIRAAQEQVADAGRDLARAQRDEADAQRDLNRERADALADLIDLRDLVRDLALDEEGASIALQRTRERQAQVAKDAKASALDRREAAHDVAVAEDRLADIQRDRARRTKELTDREKAGVNGARNVIEAQRRLADAHERTVAAQRRVAQANRDLAETRLAQTLQGGSAAATTLADKLAALSPAARELYRWLKANKVGFAAFRRAVEQATLPGFVKFLRDVSTRGRSGASALDIMQRSTIDLGAVIGDTAGRLGDLVKTEYFKGRLRKITDENTRAFENLNDTVVTLTRPFARLFAASAPQLTRLTGHVERLADRFADWIDTFSDADLEGFFKRAGDELAKWWRVASNLGRIILGVFRASLPSGSDLVTRLGEFTDRIADWVNSKEGQDRIRRFFEFFKSIDYAKMARVVGQAVVLAGIFRAGNFIVNHPILALLGALAVQYPQETAEFLERATDALGGVLKWVNDHPTAATTLLAILAAYKGLSAVGNLRLPTLPSLGSLTGKTAVMNVTAGTVNIAAGLPGKLGAGAAAAGGLSGGAIAAIATGVVLALIAGGIGFNDARQGRQDPHSRLVKNGPFKDPLALLQTLSPAYVIGFWLQRGIKMGFALTDGIRQGISAAAKALADWIREKFRDLVSIPFGHALGVGGGGSTVTFPMGADLVTGLWDGVVGRLTAFTGWIRDSLWAPISTALSTALGVASPSTKTLPMGVDLIAGLAQGVVRRLGEFVTWIGERLWAVVGGALRAALGVASPSVKTQSMGADLIAGLLVGVTGALPGAAAALYEAALSLVRAFGRGWDRLREFATAPVRFIIDTVINRGLIDTYNKLAKVFGAPAVPHVAWNAGPTTPQRATRSGLQEFAAGGPVIGPGTGVSDSIVARLSNGEHVWTAREVAAAGGHRAVERLRDTALTGGVGDGLGDLLARARDKASDAFSGVTDLLTNPGKALQGLVNRLIALIPNGATSFGRTIAAVPRKILSAVIAKVSSFFTGEDGGAGVTGGGLGWERMMQILHGPFPGLPLFSGFRRNSVTSSGNRSWHAVGRAVDIPPRHDVFNFIYDNFLSGTRELIWLGDAARNIRNGRHFRYSDALLRQHGVAGMPNAHIHWAMDSGGYIMPGWNPPIWNGTGRPEPVLTDQQWQVMQANARGGDSPGNNYNFTFANTTLTPAWVRAMQDRDAALARVGRPN